MKKSDITDGKPADETMGAKNYCEEMAIAVGQVRECSVGTREPRLQLWRRRNGRR